MSQKALSVGVYLVAFASLFFVASAHASGAFNIGDRLIVTSSVHVRSCAGTSCTNLGTQQQGALGTVVGGPTVANGYTWWQINYDAAPSGWSAQAALAKYFTIGERVKVQNGPLNVRASAGSTGTVLGTQATGNLGTIAGGPTYINGYQWWNINYDVSPDGWSAANAYGTSYLLAAP